jgi:hypothetical protein
MNFLKNLGWGAQRKEQTDKQQGYIKSFLLFCQNKRSGYKYFVRMSQRSENAEF